MDCRVWDIISSSLVAPEPSEKEKARPHLQERKDLEEWSLLWGSRPDPARDKHVARGARLTLKLFQNYAFTTPGISHGACLRIPTHPLQSSTWMAEL